MIGLSVARELRLAGVDRVVVLEREASVGQGSSSRANGGVRAQFTTRANIEFSAFSIAELERLDAATGLLGFHQTGYLLLCGTEAGRAGAGRRLRAPALPRRGRALAGPGRGAGAGPVPAPRRAAGRHLPRPRRLPRPPRGGRRPARRGRPPGRPGGHRHRGDRRRAGPGRGPGPARRRPDGAGRRWWSTPPGRPPAGSPPSAGATCRWHRCAATWPMSASRAAPAGSSPCASTWTPGC